MVCFFALSNVSLDRSKHSFPPSVSPLATELVDHKVRTSVKIDSVRELYQTAIGAHLEQCQCLNQAKRGLLIQGLVPRGDLPETLRQMRELDDDWRTLGLTPSSYTPGIIATSCTGTFPLNPG